MALIDEASLSDKQIVDLAFEYLSKEQLCALTEATTLKLAGLRNAYKFQGPWYQANRTKARVAGANPPCGNLQGTFDESAIEAGKNLIIGAAPIFAAMGVGAVAVVIVLAIGALVNFWAQSYQEDANCIVILGLLPGKLDADWIAEHVTINFYLDDAWGNRQISPGEHNWASLDAAIIPSKPHIKLPVQRTPQHDDGQCEMTMIAASFKNWSHTSDRRVRMELITDAFPEGIGTCADYSVINREQYESEIVRCIPVELRRQLIADYGRAITHGSQRI